MVEQIVNALDSITNSRHIFLHHLTKKRTTTKLTTNLSSTVLFGDPDGSVVLEVVVLEVMLLEVVGVTKISL